MSTYRERREARAERLREWAEKREAKAAADVERAHTMAEGIPFGQPVMGARDRNYRDRIGATMDRGIEHQRKAESMAARADTIEAQAAHAIYSDDTDAIERLRERIAGLEAERDRIKAYNASCRAGAPDESLLDERQRRGLESVRKHAPYQLGKNGAMPGYALTNLGGNISKQRKRLDALVAAAARRQTEQGEGESDAER